MKQQRSREGGNLSERKQHVSGRTNIYHHARVCVCGRLESAGTGGTEVGGPPSSTTLNSQSSLLFVFWTLNKLHLFYIFTASIIQSSELH